jgi:hypothetical protein
MSAPAKLSPEERFKIVTMELCDLMIELLSKQQNPPIPAFMVSIAKIYMASLSHDRLIENYIHYSRNHWNSILKKDTKYFLENKVSVFGELPQGNGPELFASFMGKDNKPEDIEMIWTFQHTFVKMAIRYIHNRRSPYRTVAGMPAYRSDYFNDVNITDMAQKFRIDLVFT